MKSSLLRNPRIWLGLLMLAAVIAAFVFLPLEDLLRSVQAWAGEHGRAALLVVGALAALGILLMLPFSLTMMLCGFLFGPWLGLAVVWGAGLVASTAAFVIGRTIARPWIERRIRRSAAFTAIDRAVRRKAFLVVLLSRLVMFLPYPAMNYSLGLTDVGLRPYLLGTNIGMLVPMFLFVYLGASAESLGAILDGRVRLQPGELLVGIGATVVVLVVIGLIIRSAGRVLREELAAAAASRPGP